LVLDDGPTIEKAVYLGDHGTNNQAEYGALILALKLSAQHGVTMLKIRSDSRLIVEQVIGAWRVKEPSLRPFVDRARALAATFEQIEIRHVPREQNSAADALVTALLDEKVGKKRGERRA
jgi:ribonuclease HI